MSDDRAEGMSEAAVAEFNVHLVYVLRIELSHSAIITRTLGTQVEKWTILRETEVAVARLDIN